MTYIVSSGALNSTPTTLLVVVRQFPVKLITRETYIVVAKAGEGAICYLFIKLIMHARDLGHIQNEAVVIIL